MSANRRTTRARRRLSNIRKGSQPFYTKLKYGRSLKMSANLAQSILKRNPAVFDSMSIYEIVSELDPMEIESLRVSSE